MHHVNPFKKHRLYALFFALTLVLSAVFSPLTAFAEEKIGPAEAKTVSYASPAIPSDTGETVDLSEYSVMLTDTAVLNAAQIEWSSDDIEITGKTVTPTARGVYELTATVGSKHKTVYLVVKSPEETEYVLYEEDFESSNSLSKLGYETVQCEGSSQTPAIEDGKLVLSAQKAGDNYIRVLLPEWLGAFGNYKIETLATMSAYQTVNRWMGVMFRVQNNNYPYYQFTARGCSEASNGTELALRTVKNAWDVQYTVPYAHRACDGTYRSYTIEAYGSCIRTSIDGTTLVATSAGTLSKNGRIGLQVRACEMSVEEIRVTLQLAEPDGTATYMAEVRDPASNVILPPSVVAEIRTESELETLKAALEAEGSDLPATAIFTLGADLKASFVGNSLTVEEILDLLDERVIPAFRIDTEAIAETLCSYLEKNRVIDVFIVSDDSNVLKKARATYTSCRAVLDFSETDTLPALSEIREATNACGARICLLPQSCATKDGVSFLQSLYITVWIASENTETARVEAIVSGANGITASSFSAVTACYTKYFEENTIVRPSGFVGHRGVPSLAQENTVAGSMLAYELGATGIENDVYLTRDGVVVVMHDTTLDRTTNGTGKVTDYTYAELCEFVVDGNPDCDPEPIPTLEDYFKAFRGLDVILWIEIKTSDTAICPAIADLIERYDILDQVNVIAFGTSIMEAMKQACPEVSVGYLTSSPALNEDSPTAAVELILSQVQEYDTTYNPSYSNGALGPNLIRAAAHRGITVWPWTVNKKDQLNDYFFYGTHGITTNYMQYISSCTKRVETDRTAYVANTGDPIELTVNATNYDRSVDTLKVGSLVFIEGDDIFSYRDGILTADGTGKATLMLSVPCLSPDGDIYYLCTTPFTAEVGDGLITEDSETEAADSETEDPSGSTPVGTDTDNAPQDNGCKGLLSAPAAIFAATVLTAGAATLRKRRDSVRK